MAAKKVPMLTHFQTLTEQPKFRWRVVTGLFAAGMLGMMAAFAVAPGSLPESVGLETVVQPLNAAPLAIGLDGNFVYVDRVQRNDTVASLLNRLGVDDPEALNFLRNDPSASAVARQLRPGKTVAVATDATGRLIRLDFPLNGQHEGFLVVHRSPDGFRAAEEVAKPEIQTEMKSGEIRSSLFAATDSLGIPDTVATQLAEIFAGDIDFHRDLRRGDRFAVTYEVQRVRGEPIRAGRILAAEFANGGQTLRAIRFVGADGSEGYYDANGRSLRKAFLRSPIEFSRVTSGFSNARFHPVLKEWRAHRGIDYGAPTGTRVRATGDGVIEFIGRQGGYGNLIVARHAGGYSTAYGHLNGFAAGLRKGSRIRQGDLIGYVGRTGLASGPHLHYEFRIGDRQVNPLSIALPEAPPLFGANLAAFRSHASAMVSRLDLAQLPTGAMID